MPSRQEILQLLRSVGDARDNVSLEALYMFEFEEIEIDAAGTYFSSNDFATPGGTYVMLGFGTTPQPVYNPENFFATCYNGPAGFANSDRFADLAAIYRAERYDVALNVKNVADRKYMVSSHGSNDNLILPGAPRQVQLTLRTRF